jgi:hypothetical protein
MLFKGDFCFRGTCYRQTLRDWGLVIGGFLLHKGLHNPLLALNGLIIDEHQENDAQQASYSAWFTKSVEITGKLDLLKDHSKAELLMSQYVKKKIVSKIDAKLAALPKVSRGDTPLAKRTRPKTFA